VGVGSTISRPGQPVYSVLSVRFFGVFKVQFTDIEDRSTCLTEENRDIRFSVFRFGVRLKLNSKIHNLNQTSAGRMLLCYDHIKNNKQQ
jgi:hypothetical protein